MGTKQHRPEKGAAVPAHGHAHDDAGKAEGPGVRPGTRSRILEARKRMAEKGDTR
ncbi:MAG TPA: hypothetical protein VI997_03400 [Candidatus Thermoplasmatota archaeon]|nr:hypothetical protein [Candidatus Thermoplasmatota archaeon]